MILPDGEQYKSLTVLDTVFTALLKNRMVVIPSLVALGGGVIGDLTVLRRASYQRGVHVSSSANYLTVVQVDSSVGGKTAVNHPLAKHDWRVYQPASWLSI